MNEIDAKAASSVQSRYWRYGVMLLPGHPGDCSGWVLKPLHQLGNAAEDRCAKAPGAKA